MIATQLGSSHTPFSIVSAARDPENLITHNFPAEFGNKLPNPSRRQSVGSDIDLLCLEGVRRGIEIAIAIHASPQQAVAVYPAD